MAEVRRGNVYVLEEPRCCPTWWGRWLVIYTPRPWNGRWTEDVQVLAKVPWAWLAELLARYLRRRTPDASLKV